MKADRLDPGIECGLNIRYIKTKDISRRDAKAQSKEEAKKKQRSREANKIEAAETWGGHGAG